MSAKDDISDSSAPLVEHLAELRNRLIWSVCAFMVGMVLCFIVAEPILDFMLHPIEEAMRALGNPNPVMQYTAPQEYFFTLMHIAMVGGLMISFPVIGYQLWRFVAPGLYRSEKQAFLPFLIASPVLFAVGASFAHFVVTPMAMQFFLGYADSASILTALLPGFGDVPADAVVAPAAAA
ncbi:MAG: twin-arginine translocase subunit TatC, partial [Albidovulum sp.]